MSGLCTGSHSLCVANWLVCATACGRNEHTISLPSGKAEWKKGGSSFLSTSDRFAPPRDILHEEPDVDNPGSDSGSIDYTLHHNWFQLHCNLCLIAFDMWDVTGYVDEGLMNGLKYHVVLGGPKLVIRIAKSAW